MRTFDLTPLLRSTVGFDHLSRLLDSATRIEESASAYPPYNIEKLSDDAYCISMAVAGFDADDLDITQHDQTLIVTARTKETDAKPVYLHRGIAGRGFERRFALADHIKVVDANLDKGLLHINLKREVPEALKPRSIAIGSRQQTQAIEHQAA